MQEVNAPLYRWGGMFSAWGQGERYASQGICFAPILYRPRQLPELRIGRDQEPIRFYFPRWVPLAMAQEWFDFCVNHLIPEEFQEYMKFKRVQSKADWPRKWKDVLPPREILDTFLEEEPDWAHPEALEALRCGEALVGAVPWMVADLHQDLPSGVMFTVANLLRYPLEQGPLTATVLALRRMNPKWSASKCLAVGTLFSGTHSHCIRVLTWCPLSRLAPSVKSYDFRARFLKAWNSAASFADQPEKDREIDDVFMVRLGNVGGDAIDVVANDTYEMVEYVHNEVKLITRCEHMPKALDILLNKKEAA